jgi:hypothetical protein
MSELQSAYYCIRLLPGPPSSAKPASQASTVLRHPRRHVSSDQMVTFIYTIPSQHPQTVYWKPLRETERNIIVQHLSVRLNPDFLPLWTSISLTDFQSTATSPSHQNNASRKDRHDQKQAVARPAAHASRHDPDRDVAKVQGSF